MTEPGSGPGAGSAILYLDIDDEITSAAARVRAAPEGDVAIVLPHGSRVATSRINFRLLAREAAGRGRRLSIVAPDSSTRALALSAGLPVFSSVAEFESAPASRFEAGSADASRPEGSEEAVVIAGAGASAPASDAPDTATSDATDDATQAATQPGSLFGRFTAGSIPVVGRRRRAAAPSVRTSLILLAIAGVAIVGAMVGFITLPSATIVVSPRLEAVGPIQLEIVADPEVTDVDPEGPAVPAQRLTLDVTASNSFPASGKRVETTKATGTVTFQNCDTGRAQTVSSGAVVSTAGNIRFATTTVANVPRASIFPFSCKTADVPIVAVTAGPEGNVGAGAINRIPSGYDSVVLSVTNAAPTTGGSRTEFPRIVQADVAAALEALGTTARTDFATRVADLAQTPGAVTVFAETARLGELAPSVDPATLIGKEQATFELGVTGTGTVSSVDTAPLQSLAQSRLLENIVEPDVLVDGSIDIVVGDPTIDGELVRFPVTARASRVRTLDAAEIKALVLGMPLREARAKLAPLGAVTITVWPDWVTAVPSLEGRVDVSIGDPVEGAP